MTQQLIPNFNYKELDAETAKFVQQQTKDIRRLMKRTAQDILEIGQKLLLVKGKLGYGSFLSWLEEEFTWSSRTAQQFMNVARQFKTEKISDLSFAPSALTLLAAPSTPAAARKEALGLAKSGEIITVKKAKAIKQMHSSSKGNTSSAQDSKVLRTNAKALESGGKQAQSDIVAIYSQSAQLNLEAPQQRLVQPGSWWQLAGRHYLYCGSAQSAAFQRKLPKRIALLLAFSNDRQDWPDEIPESVGSALSLWTPFSDEDLSLLEQMVERALLLYTGGKDVVVFRRIPDPSLMQLAHELDLDCFLAEPDANRCELIVNAWRQLGQEAIEI